MANPYATAAQKTSNGVISKSPQVYSFQLTLVAGATQQIDLKSIANLHRIENIQGIYLDNSAGTAGVSVTSSSGQNFSIPAGYQGLMPLYLTADLVISFLGQGTVNITLSNFPTPSNVWPTAVTTSVVQQVQDAALESLIVNGGYQTIQNGYNYLGTGLTPLRFGRTFAVGSTPTLSSLLTLIPGVANEYTFINSFIVNLSSNTVATVAGVWGFKIYYATSNVVIASGDFYVGTAAVTSDVGINPLVEISGLNFTSGTLNDSVGIAVINVSGGGTLTSGGLYATIVGGYSNFL